MGGDLDLTNPRTLHAVARRAGLSAKGRLSQNFLIDRGVLETIVGALDPAGDDTVLEVGPGIGTLTMELARRAAKVVAVDIDPACVAATRITQRHNSNVEVIEGDAGRLDFTALGMPPGWLAAGNLPYHLTGVLLSRFFEAAAPPSRGVFLVQREVAQRLAAESGDWSLATVAIRSIASVEYVATVQPQSFDPAPRVHSAVIRMRPDISLSAADRAAVIEIAKSTFQMRRKTIRHGLTHALGDDAGRAAQALSAAGIDASRRPGTLDLAEWRTLARVVNQTIPGTTPRP